MPVTVFLTDPDSLPNQTGNRSDFLHECSQASILLRVLRDAAMRSLLPMCTAAVRLRPLVALLHVLASGPALSSPLSIDPATLSPATSLPGIALSEAELAGHRASLDVSPDPIGLGGLPRQLGGYSADFNRRAAQGQYLAPGSDNLRALDIGADWGGSSIRDALRGYVNLQRPSAVGGNGAGTPGRYPQQGPDWASTDLGTVANEWVEEAVQGMLTSVLHLDVNERGRASFSVLGLGDFSVLVSGDRSEIALTSGGEALLTAHRTVSVPEPSGDGQRGGYGGSDWAFGGLPSGSPANSTAYVGDSPLRQAMELMMELASHPLSLLIYCIVAVYAVVWSVLSREAKRPIRDQRPRHAAADASIVRVNRDPQARQRTAHRVRRKKRIRAQA